MRRQTCTNAFEQPTCRQIWRIDDDGFSSIISWTACAASSSDGRPDRARSQTLPFSWKRLIISFIVSLRGIGQWRPYFIAYFLCTSVADRASIFEQASLDLTDSTCSWRKSGTLNSLNKIAQLNSSKIKFIFCLKWNHKISLRKSPISLSKR